MENTNLPTLGYGAEGHPVELIQVQLWLTEGVKDPPGGSIGHEPFVEGQVPLTALHMPFIQVEVMTSVMEVSSQVYVTTVPEVIVVPSQSSEENISCGRGVEQSAADAGQDWETGDQDPLMQVVVKVFELWVQL